MREKVSLLLLLLSFSIFAQTPQSFIKGKVIDQESEEDLIGVSVFWKNTSSGTTTDQNGNFKLPFEGANFLMFSYVGYSMDSVYVVNSNMDEMLMVKLKKGKALEQVDIKIHQNSTQISLITPKKTELITEKELRKAACCNLSESFETSPSIDLSFTDAATGTKQIRMLGLSGKYSQITSENMPQVRALTTLNGLQLIPGAWVESIQLNKGAGSVVNGYESITGQINAEIRKPTSEEKAHFNGYTNAMGRLEGNVFVRKKINDTLATALLFHNENLVMTNDNNEDGFHDNLIGEGYSVMNRWKYTTPAWQGQLAFTSTYHDKQSGTINNSNENSFIINLNNFNNELWGKTGYVFQYSDFASIGFQWKLTHNDNDYQFGSRTYSAEQKSAYANIIYQNILGNTNHEYKAGASIQYDDINEQLESWIFDRQEMVTGAFFEYNYSYLEKFDLLIGNRIDHNNLFGWIYTPRGHLRYAITENSTLRASTGMGYRTANVLAENYTFLASNRNFVFEDLGNGNPYGIDMEQAVNYGLNFTQKLEVDYREMTIAIDAYRTVFQKQLIVDLDQSARNVRFYNLEGTSYANTAQFQVDYELIPRLDFRTAYRYVDAKATLNGQLRQLPYVSEHRGFINLAYHTRKEWAFDLTANYQSGVRLPTTADNAIDFQHENRAPSFYLLNGQISKTFNQQLQIYLGAENILNFRQDQPILSSDDVTNQHFDASFVWGPIFGRNIYFGFRWDLK